MGDLDVVNREVCEQPQSNLDLNYNALSKNNSALFYAVISKQFEILGLGNGILDIMIKHKIYHEQALFSLPM